MQEVSQGGFNALNSSQNGKTLHKNNQKHHQQIEQMQFLSLKCIKHICGKGFAPNLTRGAYNTFPDSKGE